MAKRIPCPKCGRMLAASGEAKLDGQPIPLYQCDECLMTVEKKYGEAWEVAYTFALDKSGRPFFPAQAGG